MDENNLYEIIHDAVNDAVSEATRDKTIGEIFDTLTDEQKNAVYAIIGSIVDDDDDEE